MEPDAVIRGIILNEIYKEYQKDPFKYVNKFKLMKHSSINNKNILDQNINYLKQKGLIKIQSLQDDGFLVQITTYGMDVLANNNRLDKFIDRFSIDFNQISMKGTVNSPIIIGNNIELTDSLNQLKAIIESKEEKTVQEKKELLYKINEFEQELTKNTINKLKIRQLKDYFIKDKDLYLLVLHSIKTACSI